MDNLVVRGSSGGVDARAGDQCAAARAILNLVVDLLQLGGRGLPTGGVAEGQKGAGVFHDFHAYGNMSDGYTEVDQRFSFPPRIPLINIRRADFELQRCRDPVMGLELVVSRLLSVLVHVDEAGRDYNSLRINPLLPSDRTAPNSHHFLPPNSTI